MTSAGGTDTEPDTQTYTADEILAIGMKCLVDRLGLINAEQFINSVRAAGPDYTLWRRNIYDGMYVGDIFRMADDDAADNPFE